MTALDDIYQEKLLAYAGEIARGERLDDPDASAILKPGVAEGAEVAERVVEQLRAEPATHGDVRQALLKRIAQRQAAVDYPGDFPTWIERVGDPC